MRRLLRSQLPMLAHHPLQRIETSGTDNAIFRLGDELGVRLPTIHWAMGQVEKELAWLPVLGPALPVAVPMPVEPGAPGEGYPWPWLVFRWVAGVDAQSAAVTPADLADEVAATVLALRAVDIEGAPPAPGRGGSLEPFDEMTRRCIEQLGGEIDSRSALALWEEALRTPPAGPPVWIHGDLLPGNVIVRDGHVAALIDWSAAGAGDVAADLAFVWALPAEARARFRSALGVDDATWLRARAIALAQAVAFVPYYERSLPEAVRAARRRLAALLADGVRR